MEFSHQVYLDPLDNVQLLWSTDNSMIKFEVRAYTTGYVGIGFSSNGGMRGSDVVLVWVKDGVPYISDRHCIGNEEPRVDTQNDYELLYGSEVDGLTVVGYQRKMITCDVNDYDITADTVRVIWSYHSEDPFNYTKATYHGPRHRGVRSIIFMDVIPPNDTLPEDASSFDFLIDNIIVPNDTDTTYWFYHMQLPRLANENHIIRIDPVIQPGNEGIVHHLIVKECHGLGRINGTGSLNIKSKDMYMFKSCSKQIYAWSVGGGALTFPEHVGYRIGGENEIKYLQLNIHYDNPQFLTGIRDSSGVRIYYTPTLRQYDSSMMMIGFPGSSLFIIPPREEAFRVYGSCSATCTKQMLSGEEMKIFAVSFHAHLAAIAMRLTHYRNGKYIGEISRDKTYDFNLQEFRYLKDEWIVKPGDDLLVECVYKTMDREKVTFGGLSSRDEMCSAFIFYYPKVNAGNCYSVPQQKNLHLNLDNSKDVRESIESIEWTDEKRNVIRNWWYDTPRMSRCTSNFLEGYKNYYEETSLKEIIALQNGSVEESNSNCSSYEDRSTSQGRVNLTVPKLNTVVFMNMDMPEVSPDKAKSKFSLPFTDI
ncbi:DBH-like monooxygenase protein 1 [Antedon mediterranea]|uniref:DBH-like monooxygenase protein 1 n=1 Tax=Antedon mediterranea TaxID=105859 RepID=UPI003AF76222